MENDVGDLTVPEHMVTLFHQMRSLLEEILAADAHIAAASFGVVYLHADQLARIRSVVLAGEPFSIPLSEPPTQSMRADSE
ncbi:MAG: hypothetical protein ACXWLM_02760 [Myxococcales bacterium]